MEALTSKDGKYMCTPEHAVELAYMLSNAEAKILEDPMEATEICLLIGEYLSGRMTPQEVSKDILDG